MAGIGGLPANSSPLIYFRRPFSQCLRARLYHRLPAGYTRIEQPKYIRGDELAVATNSAINMKITIITY